MNILCQKKITRNLVGFNLTLNDIGINGAVMLHNAEKYGKR